MDNLEELVEERRKKVIAKEETSLFTNKREFSTNYIPEEIVGRGREKELLIDHLSSVFEGSPPSDLSIYGKTGTGKTCITRKIINIIEKSLKKDLKEDVKFAYVNCSDHNTKTSVLLEIGLSLFQNTDIPLAGVSSSYYVSHITKEVEKENLVLVAVLDEVDKLLKRDTKNQDVLYTLTNHPLISTIAISNDSTWKNLITDPRVLSRMNEKTMVFDPYEPFELFDILQSKVEHGLKKGVISEDLLDHISIGVCKESGDARKGVEVLRTAVELAEERESEKVELEDVKKAFELAESSVVIDLIKSFPPQYKIILIAMHLVCKRKRSCTIEEAIASYNRLLRDSKEHRALSPNTLRQYIYELKEYGVIIVEPGRGRGRGSGRKPSRIFPNFNEDVFEEEIVSPLRKPLGKSRT